MDEARARRLALNESLFRDVNELIKKQQTENKDDKPTFVCECVKVSCQLRLPVTLDEYQQVRQNPTRFFVFPGHEEPQIEAIVEDLSPRFLIIEKVDPGRQAVVRDAP